MRPEFWLAQNALADDVVIPLEKIGSYQEVLRAGSNGALCDLANHPDQMAGPELTALLSGWQLEASAVFSDGLPVEQARIRQVELNRNLDVVAATHSVQWGVTLRASDLRLWPAPEAWFDRVDDRFFDILQGSRLDPMEPVAVLHSSADGLWLFVQAAHSDGWVRASDLVMAPKQQWLSLVNPGQFLVVTGSRVVVEGPETGQSLIFRMGARIPLWPLPWPESIGQRTTAGTWVVAWPSRGPDGTLALQPVSVPVSATVQSGYMTYTRRALVQQAFLFLGEPYGWGGGQDGEDCSYLLAMVYRCFGLTLPRNSWYQQELPAVDTPISAKTWVDFDKALTGLVPGVSLHLKGHVMLYLGKVSGRHFVLHALAAYGAGAGCQAGGSCYAPGAAELEGKPLPPRVDVMRVVVTDVDLIRTNGSSLAMSIVKAKSYR